MAAMVAVVAVVAMVAVAVACSGGVDNSVEGPGVEGPGIAGPGGEGAAGEGATSTPVGPSATTSAPDGSDGTDGDGADGAVAADGSGDAVTDDAAVEVGPVCTEPDPAQPVRITVWHNLGGEQTFAVFDELIGRFESEHPWVQVDLVDGGGYTVAVAELRSATPDELPDLFMGAVDDVRRLAESGLFIGPEQCWGREPEVFDDLLPVVRTTLTVDGSLHAYPFNISSPVTIFDRALFARAGLDPDRPPTTPDELRRVLETVVAAGEAPGGLALYDRAASWIIEQWAAADGRVLVEPDNGLRGHPVDRVRFATDEAVQALDWLRQLADDDLVTWVGLNQSGIDNLLRLVDLSDRAAVTFHTSASLGELVFLVYEAGLPDLEDADLGVGPFPTPSGAPGTLIGGGAWWLVDRGDGVRSGAAARLAEFLLSPDVQATFTAATGYVPATRSAAESPITHDRWAEFPQFAVAYEQLVGLTGTSAQAGMQIGPRVAVQRVLEEAAAEVVVSGRDPMEALTDAEVAARLIIEAYERDLVP